MESQDDAVAGDGTLDPAAVADSAANQIEGPLASNLLMPVELDPSPHGDSGNAPSQSERPDALSMPIDSQADYEPPLSARALLIEATVPDAMLRTPVPPSTPPKENRPSRPVSARSIGSHHSQGQQQKALSDDRPARTEVDSNETGISTDGHSKAKRASTKNPAKPQFDVRYERLKRERDMLRKKEQHSVVKTKEYIIGELDLINEKQRRRLARAQAASDSKPGASASLKSNGKYLEIPNLLDGFFMLNKAPADDPEEVYSLDVCAMDLSYVIEDDLSLFRNLHTLKAGENKLPVSRLGGLPSLKELIVPCNNVSDLDLESGGKFPLLERLDLSFNKVTQASIIVLATFPSLKHLDLTGNKLRSLPPECAKLENWKDRVIELLLPAQVAAMDAYLALNHASKAIQPELSPLAPIPEQRHVVDTFKSGDLQEAGDQPKFSGTTQQASNGPHQAGDGEQRTSYTVSLDNDSQSRISDVSNGAAGAPRTKETLQDQPQGPDGVHLSSKDPRLSQSRKVQAEATAPLGADATPSQEHCVDSASHLPEARLSASAANIDQSADPMGHVGAPELHIPEHAIDESKMALLMDRLDIATSRGGFPALEVLVLEKNRLSNPDTIHTLGKLPRLRILNLSHNRFASFAFLAPASDDIPNGSNNALEKYQGFLNLEELHITHNRISEPDGLMGIIWLPHLRRVYIEGNPVMKKSGGSIALQHDKEHGHLDNTDELIGYIDFNPFVLLPETYGISICDPVFQAPPSVLENTIYSLAPQHSGGFRLKYHKRSKFTGKILKGKAGAIFHARGLDEPLKHRVEELKLTTHGRLRREYKYTEDDIRGMIKAGRIMELKEIQQVLDRQRLDSDQDPDQDGAEPGSFDSFDQPAEPSELPRPESAAADGLHYNPEAKDSTFLTGVHITGSLGPDPRDSTKPADLSGTGTGMGTDTVPHGDVVPPSEYSSEPSDVESEPYSETESEEDTVPLPTGIQAATRALRHALANPISYWRVVEATYARPTFASKKRLREVLPRYLLSSETEKFHPPPIHAMTAPLKTPAWVKGRKVAASAEAFDEPLKPAPPSEPRGSAGGRSITSGTTGRSSGPVNTDWTDLPRSRSSVSTITYELQRKHRHVKMLTTEEQREVSRKLNDRGTVVYEARRDKAQPSIYYPPTLPRTRGYKRDRQGRDEFKEMREMMSSVDERLMLIETNLATVLGNNKLIKHLPQSKKLLDEVQQEYDRIERMYAQNAKQTMRMANRFKLGSKASPGTKEPASPAPV
ncbi:uncharacterized protein BJ171DRAFT_107322 [Polychytrium aggregatum]|uniref:uncharacterized protein n=1 Tax=Polychytrium aggregatum TaxID=110093 RepID=UPI0022FF19A3|nr:uncharacterized protein BJ171DRAFT_107322 [Polychytrium aggregatum]KAI9204488.1 hypothetical protein BJ171DRAFT_107322 [Polychytrium aggregatum]